jgi:hypothetical protein
MYETQEIKIAAYIVTRFNPRTVRAPELVFVVYNIHISVLI